MGSNGEQLSAHLGTAFLQGAIVGAIAALLFAPCSGREFRQQLRKQAREGRDKLQRWAQEGRQAAEEFVEEGQGISEGM